MQRIERYGVIALVILLVTIVAVTFWEKADVAGASEREQREARQLVARVENGSEASRGSAHISPTGPARAIDRDLPATEPNDNVASRPVSTPETKRPRSFPGPIASRSNRAGSNRPGERAFKTIPAGAELTPWSIADRGLDHDENGRLFRGIETPEKRRDDGGNDPPAAPSGTSGVAATGGAGYEELEPGPAADSLVVLNPMGDPAKRAALQEMKRIADEKRKSERGNASSRSTAGGSYVVQPGDSLSEISLRFLGTRHRMKEIQTLNGIEDPSKIRSGMTLRLPGGAVALAASTRSPVQPVAHTTRNAPAPAVAAKGTYVVKKGDVLSVIAERELGSSKRWREIVALNPKVDPKRLFENTVLRMPSGSSTRSSARNTSSNTNRTTAVAQAKSTSPRVNGKKKNRVR